MVAGSSTLASRRIISRHIRNDKHKQLIDQVDVWGGAAKASPRIFCGIYTYHANHFTKVKVRTSERRSYMGSYWTVATPVVFHTLQL